jgi:hypothetical protein
MRPTGILKRSTWDFKSDFARKTRKSAALTRRKNVANSPRLSVCFFQLHFSRLGECNGLTVCLCLCPAAVCVCQTLSSLHARRNVFVSVYKGLFQVSAFIVRFGGKYVGNTSEKICVDWNYSLSKMIFLFCRDDGTCICLHSAWDRCYDF